MKSNGLQLTLISVLVIFLAILAAAGLASMAPEEVGGVDYGKVTDGRLPQFADEAPHSEPNLFLYKVGSEIEFKQPDAPGRIMLENNPGNHYDMQVSFELVETGKVIYTSPIIKPDQHLEYDVLEEELEPGSYEIVVIVDAINQETGEIVQTFSDKTTTVEIKNKLF